MTDKLYECMKECYLKSTPSIDLDKLDHTINPNEHTLDTEEFESILKKHDCVLSDYLMIFLNKSPKLTSKRDAKSQ